MIGDTHEKTIGQHDDTTNKDTTKNPAELRVKLVGVGIENSLRELFYVIYLQNGVECQYKNNISLENAVLLPESIAHGSLGSMIKVSDTAAGECQEYAIGYGPKCHSQKPPYLPGSQNGSKLVEAHYARKEKG